MFLAYRWTFVALHTFVRHAVTKLGAKYRIQAHGDIRKNNMFFPYKILAL